MRLSTTHPTVLTVYSTQLPLSCPLPGQTLWNLHPKVYLPIESLGKATCPYCGTHYVLSNQMDHPIS